MCVCERLTQKDRERDKERETDTERDKERETDKERERETYREREGESDRERERHSLLLKQDFHHQRPRLGLRNPRAAHQHLRSPAHHPHHVVMETAREEPGQQVGRQLPDLERDTTRTESFHRRRSTPLL